MRIGYPCINRTLECRGNKTFRLKSYSEERLVETVRNNLDCLFDTLKFNAEYNILFFRITSDLVPFASHPVCQFQWQEFFRNRFAEIGRYIKSSGMRISMHPDQFVLINALDSRIFESSIRELTYHSQVLDSMELDTSAKIQVHVGGVYRDKAKSIDRFIGRFNEADDAIRNRLVIENDDRSYTLEDCMQVNAGTDVPLLFDAFHHEMNNCGETMAEAFDMFTRTWKEKDGIPLVDYSSQQNGERKGKHADSIDVEHFKRFLSDTGSFDFDLMLEIKDKEESVLKAMEILLQDERFRLSSESINST